MTNDGTRGRANRDDSRFPRGIGSNVVENEDKGGETAVLTVDNIVDSVDNIKKYPYLLGKYAEMFGYTGRHNQGGRRIGLA